MDTLAFEPAFEPASGLLRIDARAPAVAPAQAPADDEGLHARRFGGVARLFGDRPAARIRAAHVVVVGIGGVGSWAAEALARSGVGRLTLIDLDHVAESNVNRQVHALESTLGAAKVDAMRARIAEIAPGCEVRTVDDFVTRDNVAAMVPADADWVIDAIDQVGAKAALIAHCRATGVPVVACGAAGGRSDPLRLREDDLSRASGDALLAAVRGDLRRRHGFARAPATKPSQPGHARAVREAAFGVAAIFSDEPVMRSPEACELAPAGAGGAPLNCAGYGSIVTVTAPMGLAAAGLVLRRLAASARAAQTTRARDSRQKAPAATPPVTVAPVSVATVGTASENPALREAAGGLLDVTTEPVPSIDPALPADSPAGIRDAA